MAEQLSPFDVLGISPWAELEVVNAAYKALARKYHPDMNPGVSPQKLNEKMSRINWAKEQLEKDLEGWRKRVTQEAREKSRPSGDSRSGDSSRVKTTSSDATVPPEVFGVISVEPPVLMLQGRKGSSMQFKAHAAGLKPSVIRARFKQGSIDVQRFAPAGDWAVFGVTVVEDFPSDIPDNAVEAIDIVARGFVGGKVFVTIAPVSHTILTQIYRGRVAPPRHVSVSARISFGKHRSRTFREIAVEEPGYFEWMLREGAGSRVERECARLALDELTGRSTLRGAPRPRREAVHEPTGSHTQPSLPDPARQSGLLDVIKRLLLPRGRSS